MISYVGFADSDVKVIIKPFYRPIFNKSEWFVLSRARFCDKFKNVKFKIVRK